MCQPSQTILSQPLPLSSLHFATTKCSGLLRPCPRSRRPPVTCPPPPQLGAGWAMPTQWPCRASVAARGCVTTREQRCTLGGPVAAMAFLGALRARSGKRGSRATNRERHHEPCEASVASHGLGVPTSSIAKWRHRCNVVVAAVFPSEGWVCPCPLRPQRSGCGVKAFAWPLPPREAQRPLGRARAGSGRKCRVALGHGWGQRQQAGVRRALPFQCQAKALQFFEGRSLPG